MPRDHGQLQAFPICRPYKYKTAGFGELNRQSVMTFYGFYHIIMIVENRIESLDKFKRIFWDVDVATVDIDRYDLYIIERILDFGKIQEINWMFDRYPMETIRKALYTRRGLSKMSFSFWRLILGA